MRTKAIALFAVNWFVRNNMSLKVITSISSVLIIGSSFFIFQNFTSTNVFLNLKRPLNLKSGETLDCQNGQIVWDPDSTSKKEYLIDLYAPESDSLKNITIKNCHLLGGGIRIRSKNSLLRERLPGESIEDYSKERRDFYNKNKFHLGAYNITISNIIIERAPLVGISLEQLSFYVNISDSKIIHTKSAAIMLSHSANNTITNNKIISNGDSGLAGGHREAIAIDSSPGNILTRNYFSNNKSGSIFLYRNCGEQGRATRYFESSYNQIVGNVFDKERIGIWIASRQNKSLLEFNDGTSWGCTDPERLSGSFTYDSLKKEFYSTPNQPDNLKFYHDYSNQNKINSNLFLMSELNPKSQFAMRIEGDFNVVTNNFILNNLPYEHALDLPKTLNCKDATCSTLSFNTTRKGNLIETLKYRENSRQLDLLKSNYGATCNTNNNSLTPKGSCYRGIVSNKVYGLNGLLESWSCNGYDTAGEKIEVKCK